MKKSKCILLMSCILTAMFFENHSVFAEQQQTKNEEVTAIANKNEKVKDMDSNEGVRAVGDVPIDATNFPDDIFRTYVASFDSNSDGILSTIERDKVLAINIYNKGITSAEGIKNFKNIVRLDANKNKLVDLDLEGLEKLQNVEVDNNLLESLNVSNLPQLYLLHARYNKLTSVNLRSSPKLKELYLDDNKLTSLDLQDCIILEDIVMRNNQVASIDLTKLTELKYITITDNDLSSIDLSKNTKLLHVTLSNFKNGKSPTANSLTEVNVENCPLLVRYNIEKNNIKSIDLSNNPNVETVYARNNLIEQTKFSKSNTIRDLYLSNNKITSFDISGLMSANANLYLADNQLTNLDLSSTTTLSILDLKRNKLKSLNVSTNTGLKNLFLDGNEISTLDLSMNASLTRDWLGVQKVSEGAVLKKDGKYLFDFNAIMPESEFANITSVADATSFDPTKGIATFDVLPVDSIVKYEYDTKKFNLKVDVQANETYFVNFDFVGGKFSGNSNPIFETIVGKGDMIRTYPHDSAVTKEGYVFKGWYTEKEGINKWDFTQNVINDEMKFYAKWEKAGGNSSSEKEDTKAPQTGDTKNLMRFVSLLGVASLGIMLSLKKQSKKENKKVNKKG